MFFFCRTPEAIALTSIFLHLTLLKLSLRNLTKDGIDDNQREVGFCLPKTLEAKLVVDLIAIRVKALINSSTREGFLFDYYLLCVYIYIYIYIHIV